MQGGGRSPHRTNKARASEGWGAAPARTSDTAFLRPNEGDVAIGEAEIRLVAVGVCRWVATAGSGVTAGTESGEPFRSVAKATAPESEHPRAMATA